MRTELLAASARVRGVFHRSVDASLSLGIVVAVAGFLVSAEFVVGPDYLAFLVAAGVGLATYYVLHYPVRYYDPLAGGSVNWDAAAVAVLLFAYLLPSDASAKTAVALGVAIVGLWVAVVAMARLDVHAPPKWFHATRRVVEQVAVADVFDAEDGDEGAEDGEAWPSPRRRGEGADLH